MKFIKPYTLYDRATKETKIFESVDEIKSTIKNLLRDNILDKYIPLDIITSGNYTTHDGDKIKVIKIKIGDEIKDYGYVINVEDIKQDLLRITEYLKEEGYEYDTFSYIDDYEDVQGDSGDVMRSIDLKTHYLSLFYKKKIKDIDEKIEIPIEIGDTILGGRFKNKKTIVKKISKNKKGDITINDKPLLKYRILKEDVDVDYYLGHLEGDDFHIDLVTYYKSRLNRLIISKPRSELIYNICDSKEFKWSELEDDLLRFIDELGIENIRYSYLNYSIGHNQYDRVDLDLDSIFNTIPYDGDILSIVIFYI